MTNLPNTTCKRCRQHFRCGISAGEATCWCFALPQVMPLPDEQATTKAACLCPDCLEKTIANKRTNQEELP